MHDVNSLSTLNCTTYYIICNSIVCIVCMHVYVCSCYNYSQCMNGVKDLWCASTVWLLSTQM